MNPLFARFALAAKLLIFLAAAGATSLAISLCNPSQINVLFWAVMALAVALESGYGGAPGHERFYFSVADSFALLSIALFGGEAAVIFTALVAFIASLRRGDERGRQFFKAALRVLTVALIVWSVRRFCGTALEGTYKLDAATLKAFGIVILFLTLCRSLIVMFDGFRGVKRSKWRIWLKVFQRSLSASIVGAVAAATTAFLVNALGFNATLLAIIFGTIAYFAAANYFKGVAELNLQIVEEARQELAFQQNADRFRSAFENSSIGMALVSTEGRWLDVNRALSALLGYSERELLKTDFLTVMHHEDVSSVLIKIKELLDGRRASNQSEVRCVHKNGEIVWVNWGVSLAHSPSQTGVHFIFQIQNITDRKRAEEKLLRNAFYDSLTELPNRALFIDHLRLAMNRVRRSSETFAVVYLDLDRFKVINDSFGRAIGDQFLFETARRLQKVLRPADTIAHLSGDEFVVLLEDIMDEIEAVSIVERLQTVLSEPFKLNGRETTSSASIGIALYSAEYRNPEEIIRDADTAMYYAKTEGKARWKVFDRTMRDQALRRLQLETDLRQAIERRELFLQYQPVIDLQTGKIGGFEALIRWQHRHGDLISPGDFIPLAEETGLIISIGEWVLRQACHQMSQWLLNPAVDQNLFMSVNLSGKQFSQPNLVDTITRILDETRLHPRHLKLEITETIVMEDIENAARMLDQLKALGVQLSIDDFGTGYSSLSYLHRFPIDYLKVDRSFVNQMVKNQENLEIVRTIVSLAKSLNMKIIAEGIETNAQLAFLKKLDCQYGQGYLFSKPVDVKKAEEFIFNQAPVEGDETIQPEVVDVLTADPAPPYAQTETTIH
jgi:diguanylate cyclase (GGDEF)-like protein/PAS domain S-box-containing protein